MVFSDSGGLKRLVFFPKGQTKDGFETHIGVNHLGHFLLTCLLLPRMRSSAPARIITVSSCVNYWVPTVHPEDLNYSNRWYNQFIAYAESKLANVMFTSELGRRLRGSGVTTYSLHPGLVLTGSHGHADQSLFYGAKFMWSRILGSFIKTCEQGAQTSIHCAVSGELSSQTGQYYSDCKLSTPNPKVHDAKLQASLWQESVRLVGLQDWDPFTAEDHLGS